MNRRSIPTTRARYAAAADRQGTGMSRGGVLITL